MFGVPTEIWVGIGLILLVILLLMSFLANLYRKAGPNEAIVVSEWAAPAWSRVTAPSSSPWSRTGANSRLS